MYHESTLWGKIVKVFLLDFDTSTSADKTGPSFRALICQMIFALVLLIPILPNKLTTTQWSWDFLRTLEVWVIFSEPDVAWLLGCDSLTSLVIIVYVRYRCSLGLSLVWCRGSPNSFVTAVFRDHLWVRVYSKPFWSVCFCRRCLFPCVGCPYPAYLVYSKQIGKVKNCILYTTGFPMQGSQ